MAEPEVPRMKPTEALHHIRGLLTYTEQQESINLAFIKQLRQFENELEKARLNSKRIL